MTKILVFFANYGPYHFARVGSFQQKCQDLGWSAVGLELSRSGLAYDWQTKAEEFPGSLISLLSEQKPEQVSFLFLIKKLFSVLSEIDPDVLAIAGYFRPAMLAALGWSWWRRKPTILLSESKADDAPRNWWTEAFKSWLFKGYRAALVGGKPHKRYLMQLGIPTDAIFLGYNVVGNQTFELDKSNTLPQSVNSPYFLAINRFIPKKNLPLLISAYANYRQQVQDRHRPWELVLCGDGQLRPQLEHQIFQLGLQNFVHLPGFLQQEELLPYFVHASCFIHASTQEQWGLVVNEAMAASLPVIVSKNCGCYEDLIIEGVNGFGFEPENSQQLTDLMIKVSTEQVELEKMGQAAHKHIQKFSPDYFARGLQQAVEYALVKH